MRIYRISQNETHQEGCTEICEQKYRISTIKGEERIDTGDFVFYVTPYFKITRSGTVYTDKGFPAGEVHKTLKLKRSHNFYNNQALYLVERPRVEKTLVEKIKDRFKKFKDSLEPSMKGHWRNW